MIKHISVISIFLLSISYGISHNTHTKKQKYKKENIESKTNELEKYSIGDFPDLRSLKTKHSLTVLNAC